MAASCAAIAHLVYVLSATRPDVPRGAVYNVGSGQQTSLSEVVEIARRTLGLVQTPRWDTMADRSWDTAVWVADPTTIRAGLGWESRHRFAEGFARTIEWFRTRPSVEAFHRARQAL